MKATILQTITGNPSTTPEGYTTSAQNLCELLKEFPETSVEAACPLFISIGAFVERGGDAEKVGERFVGPLATWAQFLANHCDSHGGKVATSAYNQLCDCLGMASGAVLAKALTARSTARRFELLLALAVPNLEALARSLRLHSRFLCHSVCVLDDEPLVVLHASDGWGFELRFSGVSDNVQLHQLLAHVLRDPVGGTWPQVSPEAVQCMFGRGPQTVSGHLSDVWNLNAWTGPDVAALNVNFTKHKIWGEGIPADIAPCKLAGNRRVVVLSPPLYSNGSGVQRDFNTMKAKLAIERRMSSEEVEQLLSAFKAVLMNERDREAASWRKTTFGEVG